VASVSALNVVVANPMVWWAEITDNPLEGE
jgi:hypothetical protein